MPVRPFPKCFFCCFIKYINSKFITTQKQQRTCLDIGETEIIASNGILKEKKNIYKAFNL